MLPHYSATFEEERSWYDMQCTQRKRSDHDTALQCWQRRGDVMLTPSKRRDHGAVLQYYRRGGHGTT